MFYSVDRTGFIRHVAHLIYGSKTRGLGGRFGGCRTGLKLTISRARS
jgi:hypothetical protein